MSATLDEIIDHVPERCEGCGAGLDHSAYKGYSARQVIDVPEIRPMVTEHRAHTYGCSCGHHTTGALAEVARAPVGYGPRVRAIVAYLLARRHIPNRRVAEAATDPWTMCERCG